eukprot:TRINITY_DN230_c0_g1_i1.p1 TRINITY_DN230_c0_g1~~TRINITY_DN230_c0_g1_i1.p1  ORF type:complete len:356 (-),score=75.74 TRINITY_DN230_c0_g1_i1:283-1350(-)
MLHQRYHRPLLFVPLQTANRIAPLKEEGMVAATAPIIAPIATADAEDCKDAALDISTDNDEARSLLAAAAMEWSLIFSSLLSSSGTGSCRNSGQVLMVPPKQPTGKTRAALKGEAWGGSVAAALRMVHTQDHLTEVRKDGPRWAAVSGTVSAVLQAVDTVLSTSGGPAVCSVGNMFASTVGADGMGSAGGNACVNLGAAVALYAHHNAQVPRVAVIECGAASPKGTQDIFSRTHIPPFKLASCHWYDDDTSEWAPEPNVLEPGLVSCAVPHTATPEQVDNACQTLKAHLDEFRPGLVVAIIAARCGPVKDQTALKQVMGVISAAALQHCGHKMVVLVPLEADEVAETICAVLSRA